MLLDIDQTVGVLLSDEDSSGSGLNGLGKFLVCSELFYHYTNTCYVSFLSSLLPLDLTGGLRAVSSSSQPGQLEDETGIVNVYRFCTFGQLHSHSH